MCYLCENCVNAEHLHAYILQNGNIINKCVICKSTTVHASKCDDHEFQSLFKALVRYYFSEWDYNSHFGGVSLESLLSESHILFSENAILNNDDLESAILVLTENAYEDYDAGISLYNGPGKSRPPLDAISEGNSFTIMSLREKSKELNYFELETKAEKLVNRISNHVDNANFNPEFLYRARIGYNRKLYSHDGGAEPHYDPYNKESIHAPSPILASKGRMNRDNVSFLYLASNEATAISEVRPHPGHIVSLGRFKSTKKLRLADFASATILNFYKSDKLLDIYSEIVAINKLFSIPVPPNFQYKYIVTQLISDIIRQKGFDGISFLSSISQGTNFTFFNPQHFTYINGSGSAVLINTLTYSYSHTLIYDDNKSDEYYDPKNL